MAALEEPEPEPEPEAEPEPLADPDEPEAPEDQPDEPIRVGLEMSSFSENGAGPAAPQGTSRMGRPARDGAGPSTARPTRRQGPPTSSGQGDRRSERTPDDRDRPEVRREHEAEYPSLARRRGVEADVIASVLVNADGTVSDIRVISCSAEGYGFEDAAVEALRRFRFRPATRGGEGVSTRIRYTYRFRLD